MSTRHRQWCEHPDLLVIDKQMRTGFPAHLVAIISFQIKNMLLDEPVWPLRERWHRSVVQGNKGRPPCGPMERVRVAVKRIGGIGISDDSLPFTHRMLLVQNRMPAISRSWHN